MDTSELIAHGLLFVGPLVASATLLAALHWFPWNRGARPLTRIAAYTVGTLVIVGVPVLAMLLAVGLQRPQGELFWVALLVANTGISGLTVKICYYVDAGRALTLEDAAHERR